MRIFGRRKSRTHLMRNADSLRDSGQFALAAAEYAKVLEMDPDNLGVRRQLGNMLKDSGRFDEAQSEYERVLAAAPEDGDTYLQLGHLFKLKGDLNAARAYYGKACLAANPSTDAAWELQGLDANRSDLPPVFPPHVSKEPSPPMSANSGRTPSELFAELPNLQASMVALRADVEQLKSAISPELGNLGTMAARKHAMLSEIENRWNVFVPLMLNMSSALARMGHDISELSRRLDRFDEIAFLEGASSHQQPNRTKADADD